MKRFIALLAAFALFAAPALAAVTGNNFITPQLPTRGLVQFTTSDTAGTYKTLYTAGANGSRCYAIWVTQLDTTVHGIQIDIVNATIHYGAVNVASGTSQPGYGSGVPAISAMSPTAWAGLPVDQYGNPYVQLVSGDTIQVTFSVALGAAKIINVVASCSDF